jgi:hypothetical protein
VYNKTTDDGNMTVRTHVDDLKVSSKSEDQLLRVIDDLRKISIEKSPNIMMHLMITLA